MKNINADSLFIGKNTIIEETAIIRGVNGNSKEIIIGDNCYIGHNVQIICDNFTLGDYSKIHHDTNIHGYKPCQIGHNAWVGQFSIIDSIGGVKIGDNFGLGAHSQLWSHIKFGDTLEGCRFLSEKKMEIGDDVWFVGHCIVSPIKAENKSMALAGSVVTKDMKYNEIYAGSPAKSISLNSGYQFFEVTIEEKYNKLIQFLNDFGTNDRLKIVTNFDHINFEDDCTYFDLSSRKYKKTGSDIEIEFMKFLLPDKAKFTPFNLSKNDTFQ
jgi:acetyltransferase-like isoleucine patch superfamily enzyme